MSDFMEGFLPVIQRLDLEGKFKVDRVSMDQISEMIVRELIRRDATLAQVRKVYIQESGEPAYQRPPNWVVPVLPFL